VLPTFSAAVPVAVKLPILGGKGGTEGGTEGEKEGGKEGGKEGEAYLEGQASQAGRQPIEHAGRVPSGGDQLAPGREKRPGREGRREGRR
jgi:hypothetical protein